MGITFKVKVFPDVTCLDLLIAVLSFICLSLLRFDVCLLSHSDSCLVSWERARARAQRARACPARAHVMCVCVCPMCVCVSCVCVSCALPALCVCCVSCPVMSVCVCVSCPSCLYVCVWARVHACLHACVRARCGAIQRARHEYVVPEMPLTTSANPNVEKLNHCLRRHVRDLLTETAACLPLLLSRIWFLIGCVSVSWTTRRKGYTANRLRDKRPAWSHASSREETRRKESTGVLSLVSLLHVWCLLYHSFVSGVSSHSFMSGVFCLILSFLVSFVSFLHVWYLVPFLHVLCLVSFLHVWCLLSHSLMSGVFCLIPSCLVSCLIPSCLVSCLIPSCLVSCPIPSCLCLVPFLHVWCLLSHSFMSGVLSHSFMSGVLSHSFMSGVLSHSFMSVSCPIPSCLVSYPIPSCLVSFVPFLHVRVLSHSFMSGVLSHSFMSGVFCPIPSCLCLVPFLHGMTRPGIRSTAQAGIEHRSGALQADALTTRPTRRYVNGEYPVAVSCKSVDTIYLIAEYV